MPNQKSYLNVPYAEKDTAKALGAKWDPSQKKWYAPSTLDLDLFEKWYDKTQTLSPDKKRKPKTNNNSVPSATTTAKDKNFVAYDGDQPPWE